MFALVLFICYFGGGCEELLIDVTENEQQCLAYMREQHIRNGGCYPVEAFIDGFWTPALEHSDF